MSGQYYREWGKDFLEHKFSLIIYSGRINRMGENLLTNPDLSFASMTGQEIVQELKKMTDQKTRDVYDFPLFIQMLIPMLTVDALA
ncbi:unnamed protein product [Rotaria socialis]|uniref:Uncharacterized protein n=1 Tax=Rotaria socialis TaxID=392032 RepID=A0A820YAU3_9BILA|nr:unnamed protein product [Rotaria socialis]CAF4543686.1 unnamed protein product [Rotaria socialis]CAF4898700.1 unnamed protein product [Rotaria socialis]CAF4906562.1 unnamed protein product [Rotaria socialis]